MMQLRSIQYLRAIAAGLVLAFHVIAQPWFNVGQIGVDVFFAISGFILWVVTAGRSRDLRSFAISRTARIVPTYWIATLLLVVGWMLAPQAFPAKDPSPAHLAASMLFLPIGGWPVLPQGWSLNVEVFFYACFALTLRMPRPSQIRVLSGLLGALTLAGFWLDGAIADTYMNPRMPAFVGGLWIAEAWLRGLRIAPPLAFPLLVVGCALACVSSFQPAFPGIVGAAPALIILMGAVNLEERLPRLDWLSRAGDASYLVYLLHIPIVMAAQSAPIPLAAQLAVSIIVSFGLCMSLLPAERVWTNAARLLLVRWWPAKLPGPSNSPSAAQGR